MSVYNNHFCDLHFASFQSIAFWIAFHNSTYRLTKFFLMAACSPFYACTLFYLTSPLLMDV